MTQPTVHPAIELRQIGKRFGAVAAVAAVSLRIEPGEFFSLLGPSGCGKSTTLRMIAGFEAPSEGSIWLNGEDITARPAHLRRVGMVFQNYALFPHLSVADNVAFALRLRRVPREEMEQRVAAALDMVRLPGLGARMPAQLSGGQQQRVALARALVFRPAVVLLDEPLGALDLKLRKAMQLELKALQRDVGLTFVYVTHDQEEALTMSDRIGVMEGGRVLQVGDPRGIYERPASRFVADFIGVSNFLAGRVTSLSDGLVEIEIPGVGQLRAPAREGLSPGQQVTAAVRPERMRLASTQPPDGSAENIVAGVVRDAVYIGSDLQYFVTLPSGTVVVVRLPNDQPIGQESPVAPGQRVWVRWDLRSTEVLTA